MPREVRSESRAPVSMAVAAQPAANTARVLSERTTPAARGAAARTGQYRYGVRSSLPAECNDPPWVQAAKGRGVLSGRRVPDCC